LTTLCVSLFSFAAVADAGGLDTSFGTGGKVTTALGPGDDAAAAVAIQSDGKIVVAGSADKGEDVDFAVARYNPSGEVPPQTDNQPPSSEQTSLSPPDSSPTVGSVSLPPSSARSPIAVTPTVSNSAAATKSRPARRNARLPGTGGPLSILTTAALGAVLVGSGMIAWQYARVSVHAQPLRSSLRCRAARQRFDNDRHSDRG
jgi:hypothetical protein